MLLALVSRNIVRMSRSAGKGKSTTSCEKRPSCKDISEESSTDKKASCRDMEAEKKKSSSACCKSDDTKEDSCPRSALVLIAAGTEEMECVTAVDVLRRGGMSVDLAGLKGPKKVSCSRQVVIYPDVAFEESCKNCYDAIILPGGLDGSKAFCQSKELGCMLRDQEKEGRIVAAICAAPTAFLAHKVALNRKITSYPSVKDELTKDGCYTYVEEDVVVDCNVVTSRGPGTAIKFALTILEILCGKDKALEVAQAMLYDEYC